MTTTRSDTGASESSHSGKSVHRKVTDTAGNITSVASDISTLTRINGQVNREQQHSTYISTSFTSDCRVTIEIKRDFKRTSQRIKIFIFVIFVINRLELMLGKVGMKAIFILL